MNRRLTTSVRQRNRAWKAKASAIVRISQFGCVGAIRVFFRDRSCISESSLADNPYRRTVTANGNESRATVPGRSYPYTTVRFPSPLAEPPRCARSQRRRPRTTRGSCAAARPTSPSSPLRPPDPSLTPDRRKWSLHGENRLEANVSKRSGVPLVDTPSAIADGRRGGAFRSVAPHRSRLSSFG